MHPEYVVLMQQVLDGDAVSGDRARLDEHMRGCVDCSRGWEALSRVHAVLSAQTPQAAPPQLAAKVMERIAAANALTVRWERTRLAVALLAMALAPLGALLVAGGLSVLQVGWSDTLSSVLSLLQWAAAGSAVLGTWTRVAYAWLGEGPFVLSAVLGLVLLIVWARLLDLGAPLVRLGGGAGGLE